MQKLTIEEKARDIALKNVVHYHTIDENGTEHLTHCYNECKKSALEMAKWKDKQFKLIQQKEKKQWIEKAVEWIKSQMIPYGTSPLAIFNYIEEFKQAMKGE